MRNEAIVQGYTFDSVAGEESPIAKYHGNVCQIVRRARVGEQVHEQQVLDLGPAFIVEFGDGHQEVAYANELNPWYPT